MKKSAILIEVKMIIYLIFAVKNVKIIYKQFTKYILKRALLNGCVNFFFFYLVTYSMTLLFLRRSQYFSRIYCRIQQINNFLFYISVKQYTL